MISSLLPEGFALSESSEAYIICWVQLDREESLPREKIPQEENYLHVQVGNHGRGRGAGKG